jgi:hypothetical protein
MSDSDAFDFWYALENTTILYLSDSALETFGTTRVHYLLASEELDSVNRVRVREGTLQAAKPQILTPQTMQNLPIEGFAGEQSAQFMKWLKVNKPDLRLLTYGFTISKTDVSDTVMHEYLETVTGNLVEKVKQENKPHTAVILGVDDPWEVCLLKLMVDLVEKSIPQHVVDMQQRNLLPNPNLGNQEIEADFAAAELNHARIPYLHKKLKQRHLFDQYQDRFFGLVRRAGGSGNI